IPSINELNRLYKASWRRDEKGRKMYSRRITIINKIRQLVSEGMTEEDAVKQLEAKRLSEKLSLNKLHDALK
ncbi:hypothetical protein A0J61_11704, partial [Choanephora cucurbitarum]